MSEIKLEEVSKEEFKNFESLQSFKSEIERKKSYLYHKYAEPSAISHVPLFQLQ